MRLRTLYWLLSTALMFCLSPLARGITINGPTPVCQGNTETYWADYDPALIYNWTVTAQGTVTGVVNTTVPLRSTAAVMWVNSGAAIVTLTRIDPNTGTVVDVSTLAVTVIQPPSIYITSDSVAACMAYIPPGSALTDHDLCYKYCEGSRVTYTVNGNLASCTFTWDVTGGTIVTNTGTSIVVDWGAPGYGVVSVTATTPWGCTTVERVCIEIVEKPHSHIKTQQMLDTVRICDSTSVTFLDQSTFSPGSPIISWYWIFGDGFTSGTPGGPNVLVTHQYNTPGTYTAQLVVTNECGCHDTSHVTVIVNDSTGVKIVCPSVVCEKDTASYSVDVTCLTYNWSVTGGTIVSVIPYGNTIRVVWNNPDPATGMGTVTFTPDTSCHLPCPDPVTINVPIVMVHGQITGPNVICPGEQNLYSLPQWPSTEYNWYITTTTGATIVATDQPNVIALNSLNPGLILLRVNYHNTLWGCGGTDTMKINVLTKPTITGDHKFCPDRETGHSYVLSNGQLADWKLELPNNPVPYTPASSTTFTYLFTTPGVYVLTATSPTGAYCPPDPFVIYVQAPPPPPDSIVGPDTICRGVPTEFIGMDPMPGTVFVWGATNGTVNGVNGEHTYATFNGTGPFVLKLQRQWKEDPHCLSDTIFKTLDTPYINLQIKGPDTVCSSSFANYSVNYQTGETYTWSIYQPSLGTVTPVTGNPNVEVLWNNAAGAGEIALLICEMRKCAGTYRDTDTVFVRGRVEFTMTLDSTDTVCAGQPITFSVSPNAGNIDWNFGDGNHAPGTPVTHAYDNFQGNGPVNKIVTVTITDPFGCISTYTLDTEVWVKPAPIAFVTPVGPIQDCDTISDTLFADVQSGYGSTTNYEWFHAPPPTSVLSCLTCDELILPHLSAHGYYYCVVTNSFGCTDTTNQVRYDTCGGLPSCTPEEWTFEVTPVVDCHDVTLNITISNAHVDYWVIPNANIVSTSSSTVVLTVDSSGRYQATAHIAIPEYGSPGDSCYLDSTIYFVVPYEVGLRYAIQCDSTTPGHYLVTLFDHSNFYPPTPITSYQFTVDGTPYPVTTVATPLVLSLPGGDHIVSNTIGDGVYPYCTIQDTIHLPTALNADFTFTLDTTCAGDTAVIFTNISVGSGLTYLWTLEPPTVTNNAPGFPPDEIYHVYPSAGNYNVSLVVVDTFGCADTASHVVPIVAETLGGDISPSASIACGGDPITLTYNPNPTTDYPDYYHWIYNSYPYAFTTVPYVDVYLPGAYWLTGIDNYGCHITTPAHTVDFVQVAPAVITGDSNQCVGVPYVLNAFAGDNVTYQWIVDGLLTAVTTPEYHDGYNHADTIVYQVITTVTYGTIVCHDTSAPFTVIVHALPPPPTISITPIDCQSYTIELDAADTEPGTFNWSTGGTGPTIYVNQGGPYRVYFTDTFGCKVYNDTIVPRDPKAYLWIFPTGCFTFCRDFMPRELAGPIIPFDYWAWLRNQNVSLDGTNSVPTHYNIDSNGTYNLVLDNGLCRDTSGDMDVQIDTCNSCENQVSVLSVTKVTVPSGTCKDFVTLHFNAYPTAVGWSASAAHGTLTPHSGSIAAFTAMNIPLQYVADPGFTGPTETIYVDVLFNGHHCVVALTINISPCANSFAPKENPGGDSLVRNTEGVLTRASLAQMLLVPNPATNSTRVDYTFTGDVQTAERYIEVYDITGRKMASHKTTDNTGSWNLALDNYAAGMYVVVIREGGAVLLQGKLTVVR